MTCLFICSHGSRLGIGRRIPPLRSRHLVPNHDPLIKLAEKGTGTYPKLSLVPPILMSCCLAWLGFDRINQSHSYTGTPFREVTVLSKAAEIQTDTIRTSGGGNY